MGKIAVIKVSVVVCSLRLLCCEIKAAEIDSNIVYTGNTGINNADSAKDVGIGFYLIGGIGITSGETFSDWSESFYLGPAFNLGIELPFTQSHQFAVELLGHCWMAKPKPGNSHSDYLQITPNIYSQMYLSTALKYYINTKSQKLKFSIFIGLMFLSTNKSQTGPEIGLAINYFLNKNCFVNITGTIYIFGTSVGGGSGGVNGSVPNLLMLNCCYKFNW